MEHKLCGCPNDIPVKKVLELPPRPNRITEPHFKIGGRTSPGRFSRHFYNLYGKENERSDTSSSTTDFPHFYVAMPPPSGPISGMVMRSNQGSTSGLVRSLSTSGRLTLSPVREHPALVITVIFLTLFR